MLRIRRVILVLVAITVGLLAFDQLSGNNKANLKAWSEYYNRYGSGTTSNAAGHPNNRQNATFVTLARNDELNKIMASIVTYEENFNQKYNYDWVFLNNEDFTEEFKTNVSSLVSGRARFETVDKKFWSYPDYINQTKAAADRKAMHDDNIIYGGSESYRHMCRFQSGFFFHTELMKEYRYYWRVEPETSLMCEVDYDIFEFFCQNKLKYGWTISLYEWPKTIPTLWETTKAFIEKTHDSLHENNLSGFISEDGLDTYNMCHFWSNFEIGDLDFWRGPTYTEFFNFLDSTGNFFYERWGDAPVHSIAVSLFMDRDDIHFFDDIGYSHPPFSHCPADQDLRGLKCKCSNDGNTINNDIFDWHPSSCLRNYHKVRGDKFKDLNAH